MKYFKNYILIFFVLLPNLLISQIKVNQSNISPLDLLNDPWVDSVFNSLSTAERISQLFMVAAYSNKGQEHINSIDYLVRKYNIGGLIFFQGGPYRQATLTNLYQSKAKTPLIIAMDAEWGLAMRLDSTIKYPRQMLLGAIQNDTLIYQMGCELAQQMRRLGVHINFAPVADINNNANNPVINTRSFGENRENVTNKAIAYMKGMQDNGVIANAKHFPGHGDTDKDSHKTLPLILHDRERLDSIELYPFKKLIDAGIGSMMIAHLNIPAIEPLENIPTTLSSKVVNDLLKTEMGYEGLVFTDALNMKGVTEGKKPGEIEAEALIAGNDILLFSVSVSKAIKNVKKLVRQGKISEEQINSSCKKVLAYKKWVGLDTLSSTEAVKIKNLTQDLNNPEYSIVNSRLVESAITLVKNDQNFIPLIRIDTMQIASLTLGTKEINSFQNAFSNYKKTDHFTANEFNSTNELIRKLASYHLVVIGIHDTNNSPWRQYGIKNEYIDIVKSLSKQTDVILDIFANPYGLSYFGDLKDCRSVIISYEDTKTAQTLSAQAIFGGIGLSGTLPVSTIQYDEGHGIQIEKPIRLKYTFPEEAGFLSEKLKDIDSVILDAIHKKATPGCQVLAAKDGKVFYRKSFGYHTYKKENPVNNKDLYDIASITKIVATMPSLMRLYEESKFNIDGVLQDYLPELSSTNKGAILIKDVLTHQAQLNGWIPFYYYTLTSIDPDVKLRDNNFSKDYPNIVGPGFYIARNYTYKDSIYHVVKDQTYSIEIAKNFYMNNAYKDTIYNMINRSNLLERKEYKYSDLGYYYFYKIIENLTETKLEDFVYHNFYQTLNATHTTYLPLNRFATNEIVPTEYDGIFRKQMIHGHVHDPGAAMLGGICGHAGIFSNVDDLSKIMQMYLQKGEYGGIRYFEPETIELFTTRAFQDNGNRRALGFDKPQMDYSLPGPTCQCVSAESYGHTGFTGTIAWADPKTNIMYIFLSNRIHPNMDNSKLVHMDVRTKIQQIIEDARIR